MSKQTRKLIGDIFFWLLVIFILIYLLFPFYWALVSALKTYPELIKAPATYWPENPTLASFKAVFQNGDFLRALRNSTIVAVSATILSLLIGAFAGYALGKMRFRGKRVSLYLVLSMTMFPQIAVLSGLFAVQSFVSQKAPFIPTLLLLTLSYLIFTLPFTVWVLTAFFKGLPDSLLQAAQVDGANMMQTFWQILLPLTMPALVTTGLLAFINAWNEYLFALTFSATDPSARTVPVSIASFSGVIARQEPVGEIMAAAILVTIPLVILVLIFQARIVEGLTAGAVKG